MLSSRFHARQGFSQSRQALPSAGAQGREKNISLAPLRQPQAALRLCVKTLRENSCKYLSPGSQNRSHNTQRNKAVSAVEKNIPGRLLLKQRHYGNSTKNPNAR